MLICGSAEISEDHGFRKNLPDNSEDWEDVIVSQGAGTRDFIVNEFIAEVSLTDCAPYSHNSGGNKRLNGKSGYVKGGKRCIEPETRQGNPPLVMPCEGTARLRVEWVLN